MARLDLSSGTPIPVTADGPYSAIFDWKQEQTDAAALNEKKQAVQKKIMRTNALGEAFRILGEGIAAGQGAPVTPRNPNPFILNSVNEYAKNDMEYINKLEGVKAKKLALGQMDLQYNLNQKATAAEREFQMQMQAQKELTAYARENELLEKQYKLRGLENEAAAARKNKEMAYDAELQVGIALNKARFDRGIGILPNGANPEYDIFTPPQKGDKDTMEFVTPDTKQTIYLSPGLQGAIIQQLSLGKSPYDQTLAKVFRDIMANKNSQPEALRKAFGDNWDYIRDNVLPAGMYDEIYSNVEKPKTGPKNYVEALIKPEGAIEPQQAVNPTDYKRVVFDNLTNDTSFDLANNKVVNKKIGELADIIYKDYLSRPGSKLTRNDAVTEANQIVHRFRELKRTK